MAVAASVVWVRAKLPSRRLLALGLLVGTLWQLPGVLVDYSRVHLDWIRQAHGPGTSGSPAKWSGAIGTSSLALNAQRAVRAVPDNVEVRVRTPRASGGGDHGDVVDHDFAQRYSFSLDSWWLYACYLRAIPAWLAVSLGLGFVALAIACFYMGWQRAGAIRREQCYARVGAGSPDLHGAPCAVTFRPAMRAPTTTRPSLTELLVVAGLCLLARACASPDSTTGCLAIYNPDEVAIMSRALGFASGDLNPHNFLYPTFYFYVLFAWLGGFFALARATGAVASLGAFQTEFFTDPSRIYLAGRTLSVLCGVACIVATWWLARRMFSKSAALAAAALLTVSPIAVRDAHYVKHDVPATLAILVAFIGIVCLMARSRASSRPGADDRTGWSGRTGTLQLPARCAASRSLPITTPSFSCYRSRWRSISAGRPWRRSNDGRRPMRPTRARATVNPTCGPSRSAVPVPSRPPVMRWWRWPPSPPPSSHYPLSSWWNPARRSPTSSPTGRSWSTAPARPGTP